MVRPKVTILAASKGDSGVVQCDCEKWGFTGALSGGYLKSTLNFGVYQSQSISLFDCLSLSLHVYIWMDTQTCVHVWNPEADAGCLSQLNLELTVILGCLGSEL